jgi:hypothetical protein
MKTVTKSLPIIIPVIIKMFGIDIIIWDLSHRASFHNHYLMLGDYGWYTPIKFEMPV